MKKEFSQLMKEMRIALRPIYHSIFMDTDDEPLNLSLQDLDKAESDFDTVKSEYLKKEGWTLSEFDLALSKHSSDFSSENPDDWIIEYDPNGSIRRAKEDELIRKRNKAIVLYEVCKTSNGMFRARCIEHTEWINALYDSPGFKTKKEENEYFLEFFSKNELRLKKLRIYS